jgi:hypothetical protein
MLSFGSRDQLCSPPAVLLWSWVFTVLVYWGLVSLPLSPFSGARSVIHQPAPCCQCVVMVCWLFFNFAKLFDFGCCSLAQEMSFVDCCLPYFRQQLITCPLSALLPFQALFTESLCGDQLLAPPPFSSELSASCLLCCMLVFCLLFIQLFCFVFLFLQGSVCPGDYAGLS